MTIKVDYAALEQGAADMKSIAQEIENTVNDLKGKLAAVTWDGTDRDAYQAQQDEMSQSINQIQELLTQIGGAVNQANENYQATEQGNAKNWA
ncbi:WXG100 family type VII secretion target [Phytomonospora sp. NPDC050363]|uniref:WXG100 family type VII secretion target n=1 Tax=Phytomonospora sp. NPDC050363 TaxID=3155642 RepID=UPI0033FE45B9